jgi:gamma-glutamylcyclotransferase (GGCT)/AIG2-like uncharacterized protein YtfP
MPDSSSEQRLFVYGTLAPGEVNEHVLAPLPGNWLKATVRGRLHPEGWGASYGFPALRLDSEAGRIEGQIFSSPQLPHYWSSLDEFEGEAYCRVIAEATLDDGSVVETNVYVLNENAARK